MVHVKCGCVFALRAKGVTHGAAGQKSLRDAENDAVEIKPHTHTYTH